jgi:protein-S-isoprenylcysteine O-methyltransferase Ste14
MGHFPVVFLPPMKWSSIVALALMVAGLVWLIVRGELFARSPVAVACQVIGVVLMIWARVTFGRRSFHAAANPTAGGLVTTGPYRWLRHPIYSAILYFAWSAAIDSHSVQAFAAAGLVTAGAAARMYAEETLLARTYPDYIAYSARTARVIPFVL